MDNVGEAFVLHASKPELVLPIAHNGLNDRVVSSRSAFGTGIYLAEDIENTDQYCTSDPDYESPGLENLHARLFRAGGNSHAGDDLFYVFVVRAVCGAQLQTVMRIQERYYVCVDRLLLNERRLRKFYRLASKHVWDVRL